MERFFIGIVGPSGSGKSTLCELLKEDSELFEHVKLDNYFKPIETFPKKFGFPNWELPSNLKFDELFRDLKKLQAGEIVETRSFPKKKGDQAKQIILYPRKYILVEGFMLFKDQEIRDLLDAKIYIDMPEEMILERRKMRFGQDHVSDYDTKVAIPEFLEYGITQKEFADYIVSADKSQQELQDEVLNIISNL